MMTSADVAEARNLLNAATRILVYSDRELTGRILNFLNSTADDNTGPRGVVSEAELNRIRHRYASENQFRLLSTLLLETIRTGTDLSMIEDCVMWLRHLHITARDVSSVRNEVVQEVAAALPHVRRRKMQRTEES